MKQVSAQPGFNELEEQRFTRILTVSILATAIILLIVIAICLVPRDWKTIWAASIGIIVLAIPYWLVNRGHLRSAGFIFVLISMVLVTYIAIVGQGIRDMALVAFPIIFIFAGLNMRRRFFALTVILSVLAVLWLVVGENEGWFVPQPLLISNWTYSIGLIAILLLAAYTVDLLIGNVRTNLELAREEISKRRNVEDNLRTVNANLQTAQSQAKIGNWNWNVGTNTVTWSDELYRLNGWDRQASVPAFTEMAGFYTAESWNLLNRLVKNALEHGTAYEVELDQIRTDGTMFKTLTRGETEVDPEGKIVGLHGTVQDITERKEAEEELNRSYSILRSISEGTSDAVFVKDRKGKYLMCNSATAAFTGKKVEEIIGRDDTFLFPSAEAKAVMDRDRGIMESGITSTLDELVTLADGTQHYFLATKGPVFDEVGKVAAMFGISKDITERRRLQEQVIGQDRLASIGQLVSGIAHELNNPLTSVLGFSELLLLKDLPEDVKNDLKIVNEEALRTASIVKKLLAFARKQPEGKGNVNVNEVLTRVLDLRVHEMKVNNIQVITRFAGGLPQITGNASQLQQVFFNLIVNAEQAMLEAHNQGTIVVSTEQAGNFLRVVFADDGPGISPDNMSKIFTPFFTTKPVGKGTGLGLSICHGIITEHGGRIWAESEPGTGAKFCLELPT